MNDSIAKKLTENTKNFVIIGEAGSGKTEVSLNLALAMHRAGGRQVHFFDLDQTKPIFRARDSSSFVTLGGVIFHCQEQLMDAPIVAAGVIERLRDPDSIVLLDIGGGAYGSHMIGQFAGYLNDPATKVVYLINPYRPWSGSREDIEETISRTAGAAHLEKISVAANPNYGPDTTPEDVLNGIDRLRGMLPETELEFVCAMDGIAAAVAQKCSLPVFTIELNTVPEWLR